VVAAIAGLFALAGLGAEEGQIFSLVLVAANGFIIFALATIGGSFTRSAPG
jgi:hypothetical protein